MWFTFIKKIVSPLLMQLFELGPDGGDNEVDGEVLAETEEMPYECGARWVPGPWFNIKMPFYQYRKSHCGDKTVVRSSYLHNGIFYAGKEASFYWISPL